MCGFLALVSHDPVYLMLSVTLAYCVVFAMLCCAFTWSSASKPLPLVIPASVLPSAANDIVLLSPSVDMAQAIQVAIAAALAAVEEAKVQHSIFESLSAAVKAEIEDLELVTVAHYKYKIPLWLQSRASRKHIRLGQQRLASYAELPKRAEQQVAQARSAVASLLSQVSLP
jgi:hypothetical protein